MTSRQHRSHGTGFLPQWSTIALLVVGLLCLANYHVHAWTGHSRTLQRSGMSQRRKHDLSMASHPHVVVAGGGFGGMTFQNELQTKCPKAKITIAEPDERFCFSPLLYEYLGGYADLDEIAPTYKYLLTGSSENVSMLKGSAIEVDPESNVIKVQCGDTVEELNYDALMVSVGIPRKTKSGGLKMPSSAFPFASLDDAVRLKRRLGALNKSKNNRIVVVGGGYIGAELACTLAKTLPSKTKITMLHRDATGVCSGAESFNRETARKRLESLGVELKLGTSVTNVIEQEGGVDEVQFTNKDGSEGSIEADVLIWTVAGATKQPRKQIKGLPVDDRGRVMVSSTCQVEGLENVYAVGDGAVVMSEQTSSVKLPATAQVAMQQASVAASNVQIDLQHDDKAQKKKFEYSSLGEMLSLGGDEDASISSLNGLFKLQGPLASTARRLVYAARMPAPKQAVRSGAAYVTGGAERRVVEVLDLATDILQKISG